MLRSCSWECVVDEEESAESVCTVSASGFNFGELRQRTVNGGSSEDFTFFFAAEAVADGGKVKAIPVEKATNEPCRNVAALLETVKSLDWNRLMAEDPNYEFSVDKSPVTYFLEEM